MSAAAKPLTKPLPRINVAAERMRLAASCMAKHDIRYYLNGVLVEPREAGGVFIVATDGHRLIAVIDPTGEASEPTILSLSADMLRRMPRPSAADGFPMGGKVNKLLPADTETGHRVILDTFRERSALVLTGAAGEPACIHLSPIIEGNFPDWRRVVPSNLPELKPGTTDVYRYDYLSTVLDTFARSARFTVTTTAMQSAIGAGIVFHIHRHEYAILVVMPMRSSAKELNQPKFFTTWGGNARRARQPAKAATQDAVAVPDERGADAKERPAEAGAQPAAAQAKAPPAEEGQVGG